MSEPLVRVIKYSRSVKELSILSRIEIHYPVLVRETVAKKLKSVAEKLPKKIFLQVDSGYRSIRTQKALWNYRKDKNRYKGLVFNPTNGVPPHSTGGAVDVALQDEAGKELNLSEPFHDFYAEPKLKSKFLTKRAQELRLLLNKLMLDEGFAPNPREWWHFSYGDEAWAEYYKKKPLYGKSKAPKNYLYPRTAVWIIKTIKRFKKPW